MARMMQYMQYAMPAALLLGLQHSGHLKRTLRQSQEALRDVQAAARTFLQAGGADADDAPARAWALHRDLVARNLSPGGSADLLAAACWLQRVTAS